MEITFLVDNNSLVGSYFLAEPGLSIHLDTGNVQVLLDAGYSDVFLTNARRKGLDLLHLDWVVLSHGHFDHTWGLDGLIRHYFEAASQGMAHSRPRLVAHPRAFDSRQHEDVPEIGMLLVEEKLARQFELHVSAEPLWLTDRLVTLGEIQRVMDFEDVTTLGQRLGTHGLVEDHIPDDTAMAYLGDDGLVVIAGCAHSGICNTVEQARRVTGIDKVNTVLGGFHLQKASSRRLDATTEYLAGLSLDGLYACHCTDLAAKIALARSCPLREVGAGLSLTV